MKKHPTGTVGCGAFQLVYQQRLINITGAFSRTKIASFPRSIPKLPEDFESPCGLLPRGAQNPRFGSGIPPDGARKRRRSLSFKAPAAGIFRRCRRAGRIFPLPPDSSFLSASRIVRSRVSASPSRRKSYRRPRPRISRP